MKKLTLGASDSEWTQFHVKRASLINTYPSHSQIISYPNAIQGMLERNAKGHIGIISIPQQNADA